MMYWIDVADIDGGKQLSKTVINYESINRAFGQEVLYKPHDVIVVELVTDGGILESRLYCQYNAPLPKHVVI